MLVLTFRHRSYVAVAIGCALLVLVAVSPPVQSRFADLETASQVSGKPANSLSWRIDYWKRSLEDRRAQPDRRVGLRTVATTTTAAKQPHNDLVRAYVELGIPGLLSYVVLLALMVWGSLTAAVDASRRRLRWARTCRHRGGVRHGPGGRRLSLANPMSQVVVMMYAVTLLAPPPVPIFAVGASTARPPGPPRAEVCASSTSANSCTAGRPRPISSTWRTSSVPGDEVAFFRMTHPDSPGCPSSATSRRMPSSTRPCRPAREPVSPAGWCGRRPRPGDASGTRAVPARCHPPPQHLSPALAVGDRRGPPGGVPMVMTVHDYKLACPTYRFLDHDRITACIHGGLRQAVRRRCHDGSLAASTMAAIGSAPIASWGRMPRWPPSSAQAASCSTGSRRRGVPRSAGPRPQFHPARGPRRSGAGRVSPMPGRLSPEKGVDVLIRAAGLIDGPAAGGAVLDIIGDGPERSALAALADRVAPGRVRFHGRLAATDVHDVVSAARVTALRRWLENQPLAVLESFAAQVPVIGSRLGGIPELVVPGRRARSCRMTTRSPWPGALRALSHRPGQVGSRERRRGRMPSPTTPGGPPAQPGRRLCRRHRRSGRRGSRGMRVAMIGLRGLPATYGGVEKHVEARLRLAARGHGDDLLPLRLFHRRRRRAARGGLPPADGWRTGALPGMILRNLPTPGGKHLESAVHSAPQRDAHDVVAGL